MPNPTAADVKLIIEDALKPIQATLTTIGTDVAGIKTRVASIEARVTTIESDVTCIKENVANMQRRMDMMEARQENSRAGLKQDLIKVPLKDGSEPPIFPKNIASLLVSGSELAPGGDKVVAWNKEKSLQCFRQYEPDYETDDDGNTPTKAEQSSRRRIKLAGVIGVTATQLQLGVMQTFT